MEHSDKKGIYLIKSFILFIVLICLLMAGTAFLMKYMGIGAVGVAAAVIVIDIVPVFVGGFYLGRKVGEKKYIWGMLLAAIIVVLYALIKWFVFKNPVFNESGIRTAILIILSGTAGGMIS